MIVSKTPTLFLNMLVASGLTGIVGCAHKPRVVSYTVEGSEKEVLKAAACALKREGYDDDFLIDKDLAIVSGKRVADVGSIGLDAEKILATIQVFDRGDNEADIDITYKPGPGVVTSAGEKKQKIADIEDAFEDCLGGGA